jgi:hypothetical protein
MGLAERIASARGLVTYRCTHCNLEAAMSADAWQEHRLASLQEHSGPARHSNVPVLVQSPFTRAALAGTLPPKDRTAY